MCRVVITRPRSSRGDLENNQNAKQYLKSFGEKLDEYGSHIFNSPSLKEADSVASQMSQYRESSLGTIYAYKQQVLEDFEVKVMGVEPEPG